MGPINAWVRYNLWKRVYYKGIIWKCSVVGGVGVIEGLKTVTLTLRALQAVTNLALKRWCLSQFLHFPPSLPQGQRD